MSKHSARNNRGKFVKTESRVQQAKERESAPEPFEAMVELYQPDGDNIYMPFKLIKAYNGMLTDMPGDDYYFVDEEPRVEGWKHFDFATPAERERFENVKREVERKGQRFKGKLGSIEIPEGKMVVYAGEYRAQHHPSEPVMGELGFATESHKMNNEPRTILALIDDPDYKRPEPMNMTIDGQKVKMYANPYRCSDCAHPYVPKPGPQFRVRQWVYEPVIGLCQICDAGDDWCQVRPASETTTIYTISTCNLRLARLSDFRKTVNGVEALIRECTTSNGIVISLNGDCELVSKHHAILLSKIIGCQITSAGIEE